MDIFDAALPEHWTNGMKAIYRNLHTHSIDSLTLDAGFNEAKEADYNPGWDTPAWNE